MRYVAKFTVLMAVCIGGTCFCEEPRDEGEAKKISQVFTCQIWHNGGFGAKVIESADEYASLREKISEIDFPKGVRRAGSKPLRELGDFDYQRNRLLLIWNRSMADDIRVESASDTRIKVRNTPTRRNAVQGSAQLLGLSVKRTGKAPLVVWAHEDHEGD